MQNSIFLFFFLQKDLLLRNSRAQFNEATLYCVLFSLFFFSRFLICHTFFIFATQAVIGFFIFLFCWDLLVICLKDFF